MKIKPDDLGYQDRGMMKWFSNRMMLSDHIDKLKTRQNPEPLIEHEIKKEQDIETIGEHLSYAYINRLPVLIQAYVVNQQGNYYRDVPCIVVGQGDNVIYLYLKDGRKAKCSIDKIRNVAFIEPTEWYNKRKTAH